MGRLGSEISKPSTGKCKRILRYMSEIYAVSPQSLARKFDMSVGTARRYLRRLEDEDRIYPRYKDRIRLCIYYSVRGNGGSEKVGERTESGAAVPP
jgi:ribosomal protein S25